MVGNVQLRSVTWALSTVAGGVACGSSGGSLGAGTLTRSCSSSVQWSMTLEGLLDGVGTGAESRGPVVARREAVGDAPAGHGAASQVRAP